MFKDINNYELKTFHSITTSIGAGEKRQNTAIIRPRGKRFDLWRDPRKISVKAADKAIVYCSVEEPPSSISFTTSSRMTQASPSFPISEV